MGKNMKIALIVSLCCFVFGIMLTGGAALILFSAEKNEGVAGLVDCEIPIDKIQSADFRILDEPLLIQVGGSPGLKWTETHNGTYTVEGIESGALVFSRENRGMGFYWNRQGFHVPRPGDFLRLIPFAGRPSASNRPVVLTLPREHPVLETLNLTSAASPLAAENIKIGKLEGIAANGEVTLEDCRIDWLTLNGANIECRVSGGELGKIKLNGANAELYLDNTTMLSGVDINGMNAQFTGSLPGYLSDYTFKSEGMNAELVINGKNYPGNQTVGTGSVRVSASGMNAELDITVK
ncbi:MAG: DUF4097 domain-containing protein [Oscillospiraceae bacterium]|nr:DUF4097 domain-containing protein [Oscillospiraceae bacterium]